MMAAAEAGALGRRLAAFRPAAARAGRVAAADGLILEVAGLPLAIGRMLRLERSGGLAEVAGFRDGRLVAVALEAGAVAPGDWVLDAGADDGVGVGPGLMGRAADGLGRPLDGGGPIRTVDVWPLAGRPVPPLARGEVADALATGVRPVDALLTLGVGQRVALIAGTGVGKSTLLEQLAAGAAADAVVLALIGERGREIAGFLGRMEPAVRARTHLVAVPADASAPMKLRGLDRAMAAAEWWRAQGAQVLLLCDSLSRVVQARRDLAVAVGEAPGPRGLPASALALVPRLVERAGRDLRTGGAITALFTVLAEGDDLIGDPIADAVRGAVDGHVLLDRGIAARGRWPAIDLARSVSRTMAAVIDPAHRAAARALLADVALLEANQDLRAMGAYAPGQDGALDRALAREPALEAFLRQETGERAAFADSRARLLADWGQE